MSPKSKRKKHKNLAVQAFAAQSAEGTRSSQLSCVAGRFFGEPFSITNLADHPNFWQLVIDGRFHQYGKTFFDIDRQGAPGEPGYVDRANNAFRTELIPNISKPLTVDMMVNFHDALTDRLAGHKKGLRSCENKGGAAGSVCNVTAFPVFVDCSPEDITLTSDGAEEIYSARREESTFDYYPYQLWSFQCSGEASPVIDDHSMQGACDSDAIEGFKIITLPTNITLCECLESHIASYHQSIQEAGDDYMGKVWSICKFLATLERVHPFNDGNCRTVYLLLQKLLLDNNFPLTIFDNPNTFDGFSAKELAEDVVLGMDKFAACFPNIVFPTSIVSREALNGLLDLKEPKTAAPKS